MDDDGGLDGGLDGGDAAPETPFDGAGFEDQAWHLALSIDVDIELGELTPAFDELADAMLVWVRDSEAAALSDRVLDQVWSPELETAIRAGLERVAGRPGERCRDAESALADLARNGRTSDIARAFAQRVAMDLSNEDAGFVCLCCLEERIAAARDGERCGIALEAAHLARRDAGVSSSELRDAVSSSLSLGARDDGSRLARHLATDPRRAAVRARIDRIARLGRSSMPALAGELTALLDGEPPSDPGDDLLWRATCLELLEGLDSGTN